MARKVNPIIQAFSECRRKAGVEPFKKATSSQKADVEACVQARTGWKPKGKTK